MTPFAQAAEPATVRPPALGLSWLPRTTTLAPVDALTPWGVMSVPTVPTDHDFMALHNAYRRLGGLARAHELSRVWADDEPAHRGRLESMIDRGRAFAFHWHDGVWLPRFQLDRTNHDTTPAVTRVLEEFGARWNGWELACWFVEPNVWLDDQAPADRLAVDLPRVLEAARADRFVRLG
jgi:hypothetical protein